MKYRDAKGRFIKGFIPWNRGVIKENNEWAQLSSERMKRNPPMKNLQFRKKMIETRKRLFREGKLISPFKGHSWGLCKNCGKIHINGILGKSRSEETKRKISQKPGRGKKISKKLKEGYKTRKIIPSMLGKTSLRKGTHLTEEVKRKISIRTKWRIRNRNQFGNKNPNWIGGRSFLPYGPKFNKQLKYLIRQRDNFTCQFPGCNLKENGHAFCAHHIDYDKKNCSFNNLVLLCPEHNGKVNSNRGYCKAVFQQLIKNKGVRE